MLKLGLHRSDGEVESALIESAELVSFYINYIEWFGNALS